ncbi:PP0621 family protein [Candidatus Thioglobus sp.]|jgi:uncharacterized protein|uniref:PP0621 family protein n=1 Tax=Candidatus Thioglobus sp. TaxID=2026721 RepID=UPI001D89A1B2|nr:PP0621 family protein [Candidatus Thioglobus sp.]MBT3277233.1 hypothetical protein [Candidatus Thioglobus sp.]MBT3446894.1 hypothetical protein [Candidatus Thioglobus sp.]MBT4001195.1 hypothetical protein [Candidatus Thioglobus sp.]MBT4181771.1 hypothetical protein [Candidatus Thioglobus sp.]MBT4746824.1 hypothetical protein [Candidatus Thioglobus sp.]
MGIIKLIIIVLIVWLGISLWRKFRKPTEHNISQPSTNKMLSCSTCKTHIPENEAIIQNGKVFCSKECL